MKLIAVAKHRGYAIAIAHPYPETIRYLQNNLETLAKQGIQLVPTSQLVNAYSPNQQDIHAKMWPISQVKLINIMVSLSFCNIIHWFLEPKSQVGKGLIVFKQIHFYYIQWF